MAETLELLAPARTADIGIEAIRHGADAVYIGPSRFGARAAAGNATEDIRRLVRFARPFGVRVYATLNTLLYPAELPAAEALICDLHDAGVDALIVQDPAVADIVRRLWPGGDGPRLHASTQMDNRTSERVAALTAEGYEQIVLARELSLPDIARIHARCPQARLEVFVHGALCVSLSGRCYASETLCHRSANRGECAQICRLPFDLETADGTKLLRRQHLLSLKDLCLLDELPALAEAGARAFKIEGRLKDMAYVKNITAAYSQALDRLVTGSNGRYRRASRGEVALRFTPDVHKSFNRGFTHYFLHGRGTEPIHSPHTPKSLGEPIGRVVKVFPDSLLTDSRMPLSNGDGLCFFSTKGQFVGFRVNRTEAGRLFWHGQAPCPLTDVKAGTPLWRNHDKAFHDRLAKPSAERTIPLDISLTRRGDRFELRATDGERTVTACHDYPAPPARTPQADNLRRQLSRLGDTPFRLRHLDIDLKDNPFIPSSVLAQWRREIVEKMASAPLRLPPLGGRACPLPPSPSIGGEKGGRETREMSSGAASPPPPPSEEAGGALMTCRHCLRHALGRCTPLSSPPDDLFLRMSDNRRLRLRFDCRKCLMLVLNEE